MAYLPTLAPWQCKTKVSEQSRRIRICLTQDLFSWNTSKLVHRIRAPGQTLRKNPSFPGEETVPEKADRLDWGLTTLTSCLVCEQPFGRRPCLYCLWRSQTRSSDLIQCSFYIQCYTQQTLKPGRNRTDSQSWQALSQTPWRNEDHYNQTKQYTDSRTPCAHTLKVQSYKEKQESSRWCYEKI